MAILDAGQADATWGGARVYSPLFAADAGAGIVPPRGGNTYRPRRAGEADVSWVGALLFGSLPSGAADAAFTTAVSPPKQPSYSPLEATSADVSWLRALRYAPLGTALADAKFERPKSGPALPPKPVYSGPLDAGSADATWRRHKLYTPVDGSRADAIFSVFAPKDTGFDGPLQSSSADASWVGARTYAPIDAVSADAVFKKPAAPYYEPLTSLSADSSWVGAPRYTPLSGGTADAQWLIPAIDDGVAADHLVSGFKATSFGAPLRWVQPPLQKCIASGWQVPAFGVASIIHAAVPIAKPVRFGYASAQMNTGVGLEEEPTFVSARGWTATSIGRPSASTALTVPHTGSRAQLRFGDASARLWTYAAHVKAEPAFGGPSSTVRLFSDTVGFKASQFGTAYGIVQGGARGVQFTRFGQPTASARYQAAAHGALFGSRGTPSMSYAFHAVAVAKPVRMGLPKRMWGMEC